MKASKFTTLLILGLVLTVAMVGCRKRPSYLTPLPGAGSTGVGPKDLPGGGTLQPTTGSGTDVKPGDAFPDGGIPLTPAGKFDGWIDDPDKFRAQTVYFAFDSAEVRGGEAGKVATVADFLKSNRSLAVRVEGNCDERGTEEYNRSLGDRRATSVREELVRQGVDAGQIATVSYGEDKPAVIGSDESAWSKNRRADFVLLSPPSR